jgi:hypothetical protein
VAFAVWFAPNEAGSSSVAFTQVNARDAARRKSGGGRRAALPAARLPIK